MNRHTLLNHITRCECLIKFQALIVIASDNRGIPSKTEINIKSHVEHDARHGVIVVCFCNGLGEVD